MTIAIAGLLDTVLGPSVDALSRRAAAGARAELAPLAFGASAGIERTVNRAIVALFVGVVALAGAAALGVALSRRRAR